MGPSIEKPGLEFVQEEDFSFQNLKKVEEISYQGFKDFFCERNGIDLVEMLNRVDDIILKIYEDNNKLKWIKHNDVEAVVEKLVAAYGVETELTKQTRDGGFDLYATKYVEYCWSDWAMPKGENGNLDHHLTLTGPELVQFVDQKLFPYLSDFKQKVGSPQTIAYTIGEIFS